jgi:YegS/Rv2252/BmrU family lipid kinase
MTKEIGKILFVINPISGGTDKSELIDLIEEFTEANYLIYRIFYTTGSEDLQKLKNEISDFEPDLIAAVGGDGTCNFVAQSIVSTETIMAIIPLGSANGLATELGIPKNLENSLNLILSGKTKVIDTVLINDKLCLHISDIGLNARVIKRFEKDKIRGLFSYMKHFFKELWGAEPFRISLILENGKEIRRKAHLLAIANASKYGTGAIINPNGLVDDGKFEVVIVKPYSFYGFFSIAAAIFMGYLDKIKYVEIESFTKIRIKKIKNQPWHIDGEIIDDSNEVEARINPASLKIRVPQE